MYSVQIIRLIFGFIAGLVRSLILNGNLIAFTSVYWKPSVGVYVVLACMYIVVLIITWLFRNDSDDNLVFSN